MAVPGQCDGPRSMAVRVMPCPRFHDRSMAGIRIVPRTTSGVAARGFDGIDSGTGNAGDASAGTTGSRRRIGESSASATVDEGAEGSTVGGTVVVLVEVVVDDAARASPATIGSGWSAANAPTTSARATTTTKSQRAMSPSSSRLTST